MALQATEFCNDPAMWWLEIQELEQGLTGHHPPLQAHKLKFEDGSKATMDEQNAEVLMH